ncbi:hypothetical protein C8J56DRAFT_1037406 [Mycena floridula]|nr:hypothetical protein C8J56DRAFT_1037406 [Mycena floridula]
MTPTPIFQFPSGPTEWTKPWKIFSCHNYLAYGALLELRSEPCFQESTRAVTVELLLDIPIDIIVSIFERLHPIDLLHLTKANKSLRKWIISPAFASAWRSAYSEYPDIPKAPKGFSVYKWTYLLFDPAGTCFKCDSEEVVMIDFVLRARLCTDCLMSSTEEIDSQLVPTIHEIDPDSNLRLSDSLAARTFRWSGQSIIQDGTTTTRGHLRGRGGRGGGRRSGLGRVSRSILSHVRQQINQRRDGIISPAKYKDALDVRIRESRDLERFAAKSIEWAWNVRLKVHTELVENLTPRACVTFIQFGFQPADIAQARPRIQQYLYDCVWDLSGGKILPLVLDWTMVHSIAQYCINYTAYNGLLPERRSRVEEALLEYRKSISPQTWQCYPPTYRRQDMWMYESRNPLDWFHWPAIRDLIYGEKYRSEEAFSEGLTQISLLVSDCVEAWKSSMESELSTLVENPKLATSIFHSKSSDSTVFLGISEVLCAFHSGNLTWNDRCTGWELHEPAAEAAKSLIMVAGLDPSNLLSTEFDEKDLRFVCLNCPSSLTRGREARNWRDSVHHFIDARNATPHLTPQWGLLTPEFTEYIKAREAFLPTPAWGCNHCSVHCESHVVRSAAVSHVKDEHGPLHPRPGIDFIRFLTKEPRWIINAYVNESREYRCRLCPPESSPRTRTLHGLTSHLKLTHKKNSVTDADWYKPQMILRVSPS